MNLIEKGLKQGLIKFGEDEKFITYLEQNKKRNYSNSEEKVQAETYLELILVYGYPKERVKQYVTVKMGASSKEADIIVYDDDKCTEPKIIVECKKPDVSELEFQQAIEQGFAYAYATARTIKFIWITSGIKDKYFVFNKDKDERKDASDIPPYGVDKLAKYKYAKGGEEVLKVSEKKIEYGKQKYFELKTVTEDELTRIFKQAHQALWAGGELNPSEAFDELDKLIFCKIWDERHPRKKGEPYSFQIFSEETEEKTTKELYKRITNLYAEGKKRDPEVFKDDIRLSPQKVKTVVGYLEAVSLSTTDLDSKGKAFETFMGSYFRGDFGQFFTPRNIVKFIVEVLPITSTSRVLDTSCGSGGFLLYALDKIRKQADEYYPNFETEPKEATEHWKYWHDFAEENLFGIEINEQIARTAKMNMIIHDDGHTNVISTDGLLKSDAIIKKNGNKEFKYDSFDFIITNPPFGSTVKQTERAYLHQYNLGNKDTSWLDINNTGVKGRANQSTEVLFIEQCYNFLKPGGYLAIVVPDGILTNSSLQYVRDQIEEWYRIVAVVSLPQDAFAHTGAAVKSSVMFLRKWDKKRSEKISDLKKSIQEKIKKDKNFIKKIESFEKQKKDSIKKYKTENKLDDKSEKFIEKKKEITDEYNQKINYLKEELADLYLEEKQKKLTVYQIFMAIAEKIGYDATGKSISENELDEMISEELGKFIVHIEKSESL